MPHVSVKQISDARDSDLQPVTRRELEFHLETASDSRKEIYDLVNEISANVVNLTTKMEDFETKTTDLIVAFNSVRGVSNVLIWVGKIMKPVMWVAGLITAANLYMHGVKIPKVN